MFPYLAGMNQEQYIRRWIGFKSYKSRASFILYFSSLLAFFGTKIEWKKGSTSILNSTHFIFGLIFVSPFDKYFELFNKRGVANKCSFGIYIFFIYVDEKKLVGGRKLSNRIRLSCTLIRELRVHVFLHTT